MGILFTASIVHDYAFEYGYVSILDKEESTKQHNISREEADRLFRDTIRIVNDATIAAFFA